MALRKAARWSARELALLRAHYPTEGSGVAARLPGRSRHAIQVKAHKLGLETTHRGPAPATRLQGASLDEAIRLREIDKLSFAAIGRHFGVCEASACNAVTIALCERRGYRPAERDGRGCLAPAGIDRLRYALKKGMKGIEIQLRLGVSAACVSEQRRRYNRELLARGKAPLPPPGGGEAYSGVKLTSAQRKAVEALFMEGFGTAKVSERSGVSKTSCIRIRARLVRRLHRKGQSLPGCDAAGVRHIHVESARFVTDEQRLLLREMLLDRIPVRRAARDLAIGGSTAYRIRDELAAELSRAGRTLPTPMLPGRGRSHATPNPFWPPANPKEIFAFRRLLQTMGFTEAKDHWREIRREARRAERAQNTYRSFSFDEQLARVAAGEVGITGAFVRHHLQPLITS
ncbi:hypothetical protein [Sphingomonas sp. IC081]|uniref:hypothetical protein n=1 Tax=Sphingomonas sp. IC081 TaxID=304378 RepID=UPI00115AB0AB|nr:hypothetical protein [Sphingomonas sp. IC081]QDK35635.1 hypothetical protein DM450_23200 [Sphingomonas sp. IC081]